MAISTQSPVPYTAGSALIALMRRYRDKGLTAPFTADVLVRAGVTESLVPRTLQALQILDLIDDSGMPTTTLEKLRVAPEKDYKACVAEWLKSAYAEVFKFVDPSKDDQQAIRDAFRAFRPVGQQDRMVALFLALCAEAGLVDEKNASAPKPSARKPQTPRAAAPERTNKPNKQTKGQLNVSTGGLPAPLAGLLSTLPSAWTKDDRDRFLSAFTAMLDYSIPVRAAEQLNEEEAP